MPFSKNPKHTKYAMLFFEDLKNPKLERWGKTWPLAEELYFFGFPYVLSFVFDLQPRIKPPKTRFFFLFLPLGRKLSFSIAYSMHGSNIRWLLRNGSDVNSKIGIMICPRHWIRSTEIIFVRFCALAHRALIYLPI